MTHNSNTIERSRLWGEVTAFLALFFDNVGTMIFFSAILIFTFNYPADIILTRMIPGTAVGIFLGDLIYTWLAIRLARKTGRTDVTAMPLGIDTPSTIGIAYAVLGPAWLATNDATLTWQIGMATLFMIGVVKIIVSFFGSFIQRILPTAGLLGSLAGVGLLLLGFLPLLEIFSAPVVGLAALGLVFAALFARLHPVGRLNGVLAAVVFGTAAHVALGYFGLTADFKVPSLALHFSLPTPSIGFLQALPQSLQYLTLAVPFGILTIIGGINNTESARLAGDNYRTRDILLTEAFTSLAASFFGGVAQTTPYIGHPAYKKMGARWAYTLATGLCVGVGSTIGLLSLFVDTIPRAVIAPILIFIGFEIVHQAYRESPAAHSPAVSFAFLPVIASLVMIILGQFIGASEIRLDALPPHLQTMHATLSMLANGFIVTGLLWGSLLAFLIDRKTKHAACAAAVCGALTLFGIIHSVLPNGALYLPWQVKSNLHLSVAAAYFALACVFLIVRKSSHGKERAL